MTIKQIFNPLRKEWNKIDFSVNKVLGRKKTPYKNIPKVRRKK